MPLAANRSLPTFKECRPDHRRPSLPSPLRPFSPSSILLSLSSPLPPFHMPFLLSNNLAPRGGRASHLSTQRTSRSLRHNSTRRQQYRSFLVTFA